MGVLEKLVGMYISPDFQLSIILVLIIIMLVVKPSGIFSKGFEGEYKYETAILYIIVWNIIRNLIYIKTFYIINIIKCFDIFNISIRTKFYFGYAGQISIGHGAFMAVGLIQLLF
ncbi:hypothetical protein [Marinitoga lauensis]|uniref:hypothetical protein n=1 Tax=Marinitoga lauensis TaxID=2201189 RepID=UPI0019814CAA|nr:hypothetical protein [Marinitoga lauensis]